MYEVRCYNWIKGKKTLVSWAYGINTNMANKFWNEQYRAGCAMIEMKNLERF
tara:strand:- start:413 stop:568 length:156 start_codon:yes stop_codon:yes gene_type:complete